MRKLLLLLLFAFQQNFSMSHFAKKTTDILFTALHWSISAGPFWVGSAGGVWTMYSINKDEKLIDKTFSAVTPTQEEAELIKKISDDIGDAFDDDTGRIIIVTYAGSPAASLADVILLSHGEVKNVLQSQKNNEPNAEHDYDQLLFMAAHEKAHISHSHWQKRMVGVTLIPVLTHQGLKIFRKKSFSVERQSFIRNVLRNCKSIPTAFGKLALSYAAYAYYMSAGEKQADLLAARNMGSKVAHAGADFFFEDHANEYRNFLSSWMSDFMSKHNRIEIFRLFDSYSRLDETDERKQELIRGILPLVLKVQEEQKAHFARLDAIFQIYTNPAIYPLNTFHPPSRDRANYLKKVASE